MAFDIVLFTDLTGQFYHNKPAGAYSLASTLRQAGFSVQVVDHFTRYLRDRKRLVEVLRKVVGSNTLFVGFSSTFFTTDLPDDRPIDNWRDFDSGIPAVWPMHDVNTVTRIIEVIQRINTNTKIVYGGLRSTRVDLLQQNTKIDYVIHGYGEISTVALARHLRDGTELRTKPYGSTLLLDYDTLAADYNFAKHQTRYESNDCLLPGETIALETSRGCMYDCAFCDFPLRNRKRSDQGYHIVDSNLQDYFVRNYELAGITNYMLTDDTFNETTEKLQRFRDTVKSTGLPLKFMCFVRIDLLARHPEQIELLKDAGVISVWVGLESLNWESSRAIGKNYTKEFLETQLQKIRDATGPDFRIYASFMVGLPHDTPSTVRQWTDWAINNPNIDCIQLGAYTISDESTPWPSTVSTNMDRYGYVKIHSGWRNDVWDYQQARDLANELQQQIWDSGRNRLAAFHLFGMMSLGYDFDSVKNMPINQLPFDDVKQKIQQQFDHYHQLLIHS